MTRHMLGVHWQPYHRSGDDRAWFAELQPWLFKLVWSGNPAYLEDIPAGATILYRDFNVEANHRPLLATDPVAFAAIHVAASVEASAYMAQHGIPVERQLFESLNEPQVWATEPVGILAVYLVHFLRGLHARGLRGVVANLGVGWPNNKGPDTPPDWAWFAPVAAEMREGDYLGAHEYWSDGGCREMWGWWGGRVLTCPFQVPILITEAGVDDGVKRPGSTDGWMNVYQGYTLDQAAARYTDELWDYMGLMAQDPRVQGITPYTYDYATDGQGHSKWAFMDQRPVALHDAHRRKWAAEGIPQAQDFVWGEQPPVEPPEEPPELVNLVGHLPTNGQYAARSMSQVNLTVLHYSWTTVPEATRAAEVAHIQAIARGHIRAGWPGIGYHFVIGPSGTVYQVNALDRVAYHAAPNNTRSVGVCVLEREKPPTDAQVAAAARLINGLGYELALHKEISRTACPGQYLGPLVRAAMQEQPPVEPPVEPPIQPPGFRVEHIPPSGHGLPLVVGNYPAPNVPMRLIAPWGATAETHSGQKQGDWGSPGGFELYAFDDHSTHVLEVGGQRYEVPMVPGKTALCVWP